MVHWNIAIIWNIGILQFGQAQVVRNYMLQHNVDEGNQTMKLFRKEQCNKVTFMRVMRILRIVRIRSIGTLMHSLSSCEVDQVAGTPESAFVAWSPRRLREARGERCKELVWVYFRSWYFAPHSKRRLWWIRNLWLNVGQMPDHRARKRHWERREALLNLEKGVWQAA